MPVTKSAGDLVFGSTINQLGSFTMVAQGVGKDTALNQVVRLVQDAQSSKAPIQAFADRMSSIFAPVVLSLASISFFTWWVGLLLFRAREWFVVTKAAPYASGLDCCGWWGLFACSLPSLATTADGGQGIRRWSDGRRLFTR